MYSGNHIYIQKCLHKKLITKIKKLIVSYATNLKYIIHICTAEPAVPSPAVPVPVSTPVTSVLLSAKPSGKAENMTTKELCEWLKTVNVSDDYIKLFEENDINGGILTTFTDEDLKDMGISKGFIRKKIMVQLRQIQ